MFVNLNIALYLTGYVKTLFVKLDGIMKPFVFYSQDETEIMFYLIALCV